MDEKEVEQFIEDWECKNACAMGIGIAVGTIISVVIILLILVKHYI